MHHSVTLITTLAASLGFAMVFGLIAYRLKLPAIVGYLIAGVLIGPATPGFVADVGLSRQLAEIGIMLLMFGVGLHFSLEDLWAVRRIALPGAVAQIVVATLLGAGAAISWGWSFGAGLVFGLALSVASTVVLIRALEQRGVLQSVNGQIAVGWLVVEDLATVLVLVLLPPLSGWLSGGNASSAQPVDGAILTTLLITFGKIATFVALMYLVGRRVMPWLLWQVAGAGTRELFILCVTAAAVGIAYASSELFGVSFALGAFFAGSVMRESPLSHRAAEESLPLRDAFSVLFFVSMGMLFDPNVLLERPLQALAVVVIIVVGKSLAAFLLVLAFRYPLNTALTVSASLAQIGEFSFILAGVGVSLGILPDESLSLILAGALISISLNPLFFHAVEPAQAWIRSRSKLAHALERRSDPLAELPMTVEPRQVTGHVVLVGYGRIGRRIGESLGKQEVSYVVVERNREIVESLRECGVHAVAGDASEQNVLIQAHVLRARVLAITIPDTSRAHLMIDIARMLNPKIQMVICVQSEEEATLLQRENVGAVVLGERELALSMIRHIQEKGAYV